MAARQHFKARLWLAEHLGRSVSDLDDMTVAEFNMLIVWHSSEQSER